MTKVALITGSTSGIGLAMAQSFAKSGYHTVINGFGPQDEIKKIVNDLSNQGPGQCIYVAADLSKADECKMLVEKTLEKFARIDVLINNAGIQHVAGVDTFPQDKWDLILAVNLSSAFHTIQTSLPVMRKNNWGRIINVASVHGLVASAQKSAYVAAKHGLVGLTKVVALETAQENITCNAVCPGWVLTPLVEQQIHAKAQANNISFDQAKDDLLSEKQPSKNFVKPEELGNLCLFLASDNAQQMTGASLVMDGGWTCQ